MTSELPGRSPGLMHLERLLTTAELQRQAAQEAADALAAEAVQPIPGIDRAKAAASAQQLVRWSSRGRAQITPA